VLIGGCELLNVEETSFIVEGVLNESENGIESLNAVNDFILPSTMKIRTLG
jgi:hypothetical protein